jgi:putative transposase
LTYYQRHLPHWQPEGAVLFVTWRLYGSLPRAVEIPKKQSPAKTFTEMDRELDRSATGPRWLGDERVAQCVADALRFGERQLRLYDLRAWVPMPNHVHILICPKSDLPRITKAIKKFSARQANAIIGRTGQPFWQDESYDHWVRDREELEKTVRYIEENPVAAGLAENAAGWRWSSACDGSK